jgi:predicted MFS family arabinose efflux permease
VAVGNRALFEDLQIDLAPLASRADALARDGQTVALVAADGRAIGLVGVAAIAIFVMSGATPAALGLLADVSEGFEEDRSAIMGLYSVFLGVGQVIGAIVGGIAATWKGIDGLVVATAGLLVVGIVALLNLRNQEGAVLVGELEAGRGSRQAASM